MDETVKTLLDGVTTEGYTDHFNGKGQKAFAGNYLELWEKVQTYCIMSCLFMEEAQLKCPELVCTFHCSF